MNIPTQGETFAELIEHLRKAQESSAVLGHLAQANDDKRMGLGWLNVSEGLKRTQHLVTQLALGKLQ